MTTQKHTFEIEVGEEILLYEIYPVDLREKYDPFEGDVRQFAIRNAKVTKVNRTRFDVEWISPQRQIALSRTYKREYIGPNSTLQIWDGPRDLKLHVSRCRWDEAKLRDTLERELRLKARRKVLSGLLSKVPDEDILDGNTYASLFEKLGGERG